MRTRLLPRALPRVPTLLLLSALVGLPATAFAQDGPPTTRPRNGEAAAPKAERPPQRRNNRMQPSRASGTRMLRAFEQTVDELDLPAEDDAEIRRAIELASTDMRRLLPGLSSLEPAARREALVAFFEDVQDEIIGLVPEADREA